MTEDEMDRIIKTDAGGEVTYRDRRVFLAAVEWASERCDKGGIENGFSLAASIRSEVAQLG